MAKKKSKLAARRRHQQAANKAAKIATAKAIEAERERELALLAETARVNARRREHNLRGVMSPAEVARRQAILNAAKQAAI